MKDFLKKSWEAIKAIVAKIQHSDPFSYSATIAYSTIFSLPAMLIIITKVATIFWNDEAVTGQLFHQLSGLVGAESAKTIQDTIKNASRSGTSTIATTIGVVTLILSATTVFLSIQNALNGIWGVKPKPQKGLIKIILNRLLSFAMVVSLGFVMLVSLVVDAILQILHDYIERIFSGMTALLMQIINYSVTLIVITLIFAMIFKVLPDAKIKWKDVGRGAIATTILFVVGRYLIGLYLGNSQFSDTYGAAGSLVIVLAWVYYSSFILLLGAIFTQVYTQLSGRKILPSDHAVFLVKKEVDIDEVGEKAIDDIIRNPTDKEYI